MNNNVVVGTVELHEGLATHSETHGVLLNVLSFLFNGVRRGMEVKGHGLPTKEVLNLFICNVGRFVIDDDWLLVLLYIK